MRRKAMVMVAVGLLGLGCGVDTRGNDGAVAFGENATKLDPETGQLSRAKKIDRPVDRARARASRG